MKLRISGLLAIAAFVSCFLASALALGQNAYITNFNSNTVSVIDTATNTVTASIGVGSNPLGVAVTLDGSKVYVTNQNTNTMSVIDAATNAATVEALVQEPIGVAVTPDGRKVYVADVNSNSVSVVDTTTHTVSAITPVGLSGSEVRRQWCGS